MWSIVKRVLLCYWVYAYLVTVQSRAAMIGFYRQPLSPATSAAEIVVSLPLSLLTMVQIPIYLVHLVTAPDPIPETPAT